MSAVYGDGTLADSRRSVSVSVYRCEIAGWDRPCPPRGWSGALDLVRAVADRTSVPVVASGGVGSLDDLVCGVTEGHASAVLAASIFHFGQATIADAHAALARAGVPVRAH